MHYKLDVRKSAIHRNGCFAEDFIPAGATVREYTGQMISAAEALRREADPARPGIYTVWLDEGRVVDGWFGGNESIYLNHACAPNCEWDFRDDRIFIRALRDIAPGEELTIDYAYEPEPPLEACACGAAQCRGYLNALEPL
jgi:hypothetical protein